MTPNSCRVTRSKETTLFGVAPLIITAIPQQLSFETRCVRRWDLSSRTYFSSLIFFEAVAKNVNKLLYLEFVMPAMPWITHKIPQAFSLSFAYCKQSKTGAVEGLGARLRRHGTLHHMIAMTQMS